MEKIISQLFAARDAAHLLHLKTRSFAVHLALQELYESLVDIIDSFTEVYQGKFGVLDIPAPNTAAFNLTDAKAFISQLDQFITASTDSVPDESALRNEWDAVKAAAARAKYKIDNLS